MKLLRRLLASVCVSAGVLAIATIDSVHLEETHGQSFRQARRERSRAVLTEKLAPKTKEQGSTRLKNALAGDELGDENPFANLFPLEPLERVLARGVESFERQSYRSSEYHGEIGYDVVHYVVRHKDGSESQILAYLERSSLTEVRPVGAPDERIPFVMIVNPTKDGVELARYRNSELLEGIAIEKAEAERLLARRLSESVPFLSVAR